LLNSGDISTCKYSSALYLDGHALEKKIILQISENKLNMAFAAKNKQMCSHHTRSFESQKKDMVYLSIFDWKVTCLKNKLPESCSRQFLKQLKFETLPRTNIASIYKQNILSQSKTCVEE
jgi:hypothetical protein